MAELITKRTIFFSEAERMDLNLWKVPIDRDHPEGEKYSVNYSKKIGTKWIDLVRVDNKKREGHHVHFQGKIKDYKYVSFEQAVKHVRKLVKKIKGGEVIC